MKYLEKAFWNKARTTKKKKRYLNKELLKITKTAK